MKFIGNFFALLTSILFIVVISFLNLFYTGNKIVNGDTMEKIVEEIDINTITVGELEGFITINGYPEGTKVSEVIADSLQEEGVDKSLTKALLEDKEVENLLGDILSQAVDYEVKGGKKPKVNRSQIANLINKDSIINITKKTYTDDQIDDVVKQINSYLNDLGESDGEEI